MADEFRYRSPQEFEDECFPGELTGDSASSEEQIMECPYEDCHKVTAGRFEQHLMKCRRNYRQRLHESGQVVPVMTCRYNFRHQVDAMELQLHESRCEDAGDFIPHYLQFLDELEGFDLEPENAMPFKEVMEEQAATMHDGFNFEEVIAACNYGRPLKIDKVARDPKHVKVAEKGIDSRLETIRESISGMSTDSSSDFQPCSSSREFFRRDVQSLGAASLSAQAASTTRLRNFYAKPSDDKQNLEQSEKKEPVKSHYGIPPTDLGSDDEEEEDWGAEADNGNVQPFDYMERMFNPLKPMLKFPLGLTKGQRREFANWNSQWIEAIQQSQMPDEEEDDYDVSQFTYASGGGDNGGDLA